VQFDFLSENADLVCSDLVAKNAVVIKRSRISSTRVARYSVGSLPRCPDDVGPQSLSNVDRGLSAVAREIVSEMRQAADATVSFGALECYSSDGDYERDRSTRSSTSDSRLHSGQVSGDLAQWMHSMNGRRPFAESVALSAVTHTSTNTF
jgi:hypothetical protein